MKRGPKLTPVAIMANRMNPLARSHRIAHLRALIQQQPIRSSRREELVALLRDECRHRWQGSPKMNRPWMPLYVGDYLGDSGRLTTTRVSAKRAIAGQKGGIGSALARMKLENASLSRHASSRAIAGPLSSAAAACADHSHSRKSLLKSETGAADPLTQQPGGRAEKPGIAVSSELAAYVASRTA